MLLLLACAPPTTQVVTGMAHSCQLDSEGSVGCWGSNTSGQSLPPQDVVFEQIAAALYHTCGLSDQGEIYCWGREDEAGLSYDPGPWSYVATGFYHSCALDEDGALTCWGPNPAFSYWDAAQGTGSQAIYSSLSLSAVHMCGVTTATRGRCWGAQLPQFYQGQMEIDWPTDPGVTQVSAGWWQTCFLRPGEIAQCHGGTTRLDVEVLPQEPLLMMDQAGINGCGLRMDHTAVCWGQELYGTEPEGKFVQLSVGGYHACGVSPQGKVSCWGNNGEGQASPP